jgi:hypothetical protein
MLFPVYNLYLRGVLLYLFIMFEHAYLYEEFRQAGNLMRKPAASERACFLEEESELRTQADFLAGKIRGLTNQFA